MKPLHTRQDVIDLAAAHAPTHACYRYMLEQGRIEVLRVPSLPGWIVQVWATPDGAGRGPGAGQWLIGIEVDEVQRCYGFSYPDLVPADAVKLEGNRL